MVSLPDSTTVLPAVDVLPVKVRSAAPEPASLVTVGPYDLLLLDARHDLAAARTLCRRLAADGLAVPVESGTNRGRLRGQVLLIGCVGEVGVPASVVVGVGVVEYPGADLEQ